MIPKKPINDNAIENILIIKIIFVGNKNKDIFMINIKNKYSLFSFLGNRIIMDVMTTR